MKRATLAALVFLGIAVTAGLATAQAAAPTVTIVSPDPGVTVALDALDVMVAYEAPKGALVAQVELAVDGTVTQSTTLDPPERKGALSLTWDAASCLEGEHLLAVRVADTDGRAGGAQVEVLLHRGLPDMEARPRVTRPAPGATVTGVTSFEVESAAAQVRYVIFLVDNVFKAMSNIRPFCYSWDTTHYLNGTHQLQAKAYLADGAEALSQVIEVQVDNPSGMTVMRPAAPAGPQPVAAPMRTPEPSLPPAIHTEGATPYSRPVAVTKAEFGPPGTAPCVSKSGDLIQPPTPAPTARTEAVRPLEVVDLPATAAHAPAPPVVASTSVLRPSEPTDPSIAAPADTGCVAPATSVNPLAAMAPEAATGVMAPAGIPVQAVTLPEVPASVAVPSPRRIAVLPAKLAKGGFGPTSADTSGDDPVGPPTVVPRAARTEAAPPTEAAALPAPARPRTNEAVIAPVSPATLPATSTPAPGHASAAAGACPEASASVPVPSTEQVAMLPPELADVEQRPVPYPQPATATEVYTVQVGDSLWTIAARHGLTVAQLAKANDLAESAAVRPGQQLHIATPMIYVNGEPLLSDAPVSIVDGRMLAPFRAVIERVGGSVVWQPETRRARADAHGKEIAVTVGSDVATVDGRPMPMGMAAVMGGSRAFVPLRFLGEALDMVLHYRDGVVRAAGGK